MFSMKVRERRFHPSPRRHLDGELPPLARIAHIDRAAQAHRLGRYSVVGKACPRFRLKIGKKRLNPWRACLLGRKQAHARKVVPNIYQ